MKPPPFKYLVPDTLPEALALKAEYGDDAKFFTCNLHQLVIRQVKQFALHGSADKDPDQHLALGSTPGEFSAGETSGQNFATFRQRDDESKCRDIAPDIRAANTKHNDRG